MRNRRIVYPADRFALIIFFLAALAKCKQRCSARAYTSRREAGGDDSHAHLALFEFVVFNGTKNNFGIRVYRLGDYLCRLVDLYHAQIIAAGDCKQNSLGAVYRKFKKRGGHGHLRRGLSPVFSRSDTNAHECRAGVFHHGAHVCKVDVNNARVCYKVGNALDRLQEYVVAHGESAFKRSFFLHGGKQTVVGDNNERIYLFAQILDALLCQALALQALKCEGSCNHGDSERTELLGGLCNDRCRAGARAAALAACNKYHVGSF